MDPDMLYDRLSEVIVPLIDRPSGYAFYCGSNENDGKEGRHRGVELFRSFDSASYDSLKTFIMGGPPQSNSTGGYPDTYFNTVAIGEVIEDVEHWVHEDDEFDEAQRDFVINTLKDLFIPY